MNQFHSTVSRRDFMKGLGLGVAGIGAASATAPVFHDLDEAASSTKAVLKRGWYVKERDYGDYGIEIDWNIMKRRDQRGFPNWNFGVTMNAYPEGPQAFAALKHAGEEATAEKAKEFWPDYKGPTTRDEALGSAFEAMSYGNSGYCGNLVQGGTSTNLPAHRPEEIGMPKWQGTPEENLLMIRAVFSLVGLGPMVGVAELNEQTKKFVWDYMPFQTSARASTGPNLLPAIPATAGQRRIIFDDNATESYLTEDPPAFHLPSAQRYVIATHNLSCDEIARRGLGAALGGCTENMSYARVAYAKNIVEQFIRGLGYNVSYGHDMQPALAWDIASGVGEHARLGQTIGSPEYGGLMRTHAIFYTDLPLALTKPIDAGFTKFCETCGICAETCPVGAIPERGINRSWDNNCGQNWADDKMEGGTQVMFNLPGYKGWRCNLFKCAYTPCGGACKGNCPFNTIADGSFVHSIVKSTVATTPLFNSFFTSMEGILHYGKQDKDPESWWNSPDEWHIYGTHPNSLRQ
ncbi:dehalogenase [Dehalococcoides mccartyi]|uniref:reductive dehalogenase n=1 Tax=Dehalococcoides mccartyi TaxID=61435 RepID=UPI0004E06CA9|nr:reductive dehalogenase [Dehalococcoides mccartyi]AII58498.1 dehalogenase [Dehalococcoides mccartyi CG1]APH13106.1 dehalogenase [Dehalococcoides mccartyi]